MNIFNNARTKPYKVVIEGFIPTPPFSESDLERVTDNSEIRFQSSAAVWLTPSFFFNVRRRRFVVGCRRFGTAYLSHLQGLSSRRSLPWTAWLSRNFGTQLPDLRRVTSRRAKAGVTMAVQNAISMPAECTRVGSRCA